MPTMSENGLFQLVEQKPNGRQFDDKDQSGEPLMYIC